MLSITLGSQKFPFDRLLRAVDELVAAGRLSSDIFAQTGYSNYEPQHYRYRPFLSRDEFRQMLRRSDIVITHGGTGTIMDAVRMGKRVIAVPRLARYGEHVDDHQVEFVRKFRDMGYILMCEDCGELEDLIRTADLITPVPFRGGDRRIAADLETYIDEIC